MRRVLIALVAIALAGCAVGRDVVRPQADTLQLGKTTYTEVLERYGEPRRTGTATRNGQALKTLSYAYAVGTPYVDDVPTRASGFYFLDDRLVGYEYLSSFKEDKTDFDSAKIGQIKRGETTRVQVIALLGQPGGVYVYPLIKARGDLAMVYLFLDATRHPLVGFTAKTRLKKLIVTLDDAGLVTDVDYTESNPK